jgi:hypothetical protein
MAFHLALHSPETRFRQMGENSMTLSRRQALLCGLAPLFCLIGESGGQADPVGFNTAAVFAGLELLRGVIEYVSGQTLASAMSGVAIIDARTWIREAVSELEALISAQLSETAMNSLSADLDAVTKNLQQYANSKVQNDSTNRALLDNSDKTTASLVASSLKNDQAIYVGVAAMAYRLFTLYALYQLDADAGHIASARLEMDEFVKKIAEMRDRIRAEMAPEKHLAMVAPGRAIGCWVMKDGQQVGPIYHPPNCLVRLKSEVFDVQAAILRKAEFDFIDQTNGAIVLAATCYDKMCQKVGVAAYPIPDLTFVPFSIPSSLLMPGAFIIR